MILILCIGASIIFLWVFLNFIFCREIKKYRIKERDDKYYIEIKRKYEIQWERITCDDFGIRFFDTLHKAKDYIDNYIYRQKTNNSIVFSGKPSIYEIQKKEYFEETLND